MDTRNIAKVANNTVCLKHGAFNHGQPCWWIWGSNGFTPLAAVCNDRIKRYGFNGEISDRAMRRSARAA